MVVVPEDRPETMPDNEPTVATAVLLLVHVPPPGDVSDVVLPTHTPVAPLITGVVFTVMVRAVMQLPTAYVIGEVPILRPVTIPDDEPIVIAVPDVLHTPPGVTSLCVMVAPTHKAVGPEIAAGSGLTVTTEVAAQPATM